MLQPEDTLVHLPASALPSFTPGPLPTSLYLLTLPLTRACQLSRDKLPLYSYQNQMVNKYAIFTQGPFKAMFISFNNGTRFRKTSFFWQYQLPGPESKTKKKIKMFPCEAKTDTGNLCTSTHPHDSLEYLSVPHRVHTDSYFLFIFGSQKDRIGIVLIPGSCHTVTMVHAWTAFYVVS